MGLEMVGKGWKRLERPRPGGRRGGRMLRFAEADTDFGNLHSEYCIRLCAFNTALARKGLAVLCPQSGTRPAPVPKFRNNCS